MDQSGVRRTELLIPMRTLLLVAAAVGVFAAFRAIGDTFLIVLVGIFLAFVFEYPVRFVMAKTNMSRGLAATITVIGTAIAVLLLLLLLLVPLVGSVRDLLSRIRRLFRLADEVARRKRFVVRAARMQDLDAEIGRILELQNRALAHLGGTPYSRAAIEAMVMPLKDFADPELVLFVEDDGRAVGWFPAIQNLNEILIKLGGLRRPWDYVKALRYRNLKPRCLAIKSVAVLPEYWDTGAAIPMFAEMVKRAMAKGYEWLDLSLTGEDNPDTWNLAHHMDGRIYKRYRFYVKELDS